MPDPGNPDISWDWIKEALPSLKQQETLYMTVMTRPWSFVLLYKLYLHPTPSLSSCHSIFDKIPVLNYPHFNVIFIWFLKYLVFAVVFVFCRSNHVYSSIKCHKSFLGVMVCLCLSRSQDVVNFFDVRIVWTDFLSQQFTKTAFLTQLF